MDFGPLRALVLDLNFEAHGVAVTVTPKDGAPIETRGIWLTPTQEDMPSGALVHRREPRRVLALTRDAVPTLPNGSTIMAPPRAGDPDEIWVVDGTEREEADHRRVIVMEAPDES